MQPMRARCLLVAFVLAAIAVPMIGNSAKTADRTSSRTVKMPAVTSRAASVPWSCTGKGCSSVVVEQQMIASGFPVPWPKKPGVSEIPTVTAEAFPIPWPKKPGVSDMPTVTAEAFPIPWPKKPGFVLS